MGDRVSLSELARRTGRSIGYLHRLKVKGVLVFGPDKLIDTDQAAIAVAAHVDPVHSAAMNAVFAKKRAAAGRPEPAGFVLSPQALAAIAAATHKAPSSGQVAPTAGQVAPPVATDAPALASEPKTVLEPVKSAQIPTPTPAPPPDELVNRPPAPEVRENGDPSTGGMGEIGDLSTEPASPELPAEPAPPPLRTQPRLDAPATAAESSSAIAQTPADIAAQAIKIASHSDSLAEARAKRARIDAQQAELDYARRSGELVDRKSVDAVVFEVFRLLRDRVLSVGPSCAPAVAGLPDVRDIEFAITDEVRRALDGFEAQAAQALAQRLGTPATAAA